MANVRTTHCKLPIADCNLHAPAYLRSALDCTPSDHPRRNPRFFQHDRGIRLGFMGLAPALLGLAAMQTSIGPAPSHRRKPQYEDIRKLARLYLQQAPNPDPAMEQWVQAQREFLIEVAWATPHSFAMKASSKISDAPIGNNSTQSQ